MAICMTMGCARSPGVPRVAAGPDAAGLVAACQDDPALAGDELLDEDYDPWRRFNEPMFDFNHDVLDRWLVRPLAQGWTFIMPLAARRSVARIFDNADTPRRLANNLIQARPWGAARELVRFVVNSTVGLAGVFDVASRLHLERSDADFGQTLAMLRIGPGPFLVLPTLPPLTLRDAVGRGLDTVFDPLTWVAPLFVGPTRTVVSSVNDRSLDMKLYDDVEESVLDLYGAVRNAYLQRRRRAVAHASAERDHEWRWASDEPCRTSPERAASAEDPT